jgi:uncharacterized protein
MRTEPRRKDRTMGSSREMELLLERTPVGRLALVTEDGPYVVAVNYLLLEGSIYFHSGQGGRKMEALRADPRVCFLVDDVGPQVLTEKGCGISQIYESVACFGSAEIVEDSIVKMRILERMVQKFGAANHTTPRMNDQMIEKTAVVRIVIDSMSGKANRLSPSYTVLPAFQR